MSIEMLYEMIIPAAMCFQQKLYFEHLDYRMAAEPLIEFDIQ